ncbi:MAG TPA: hypothetical protein VJL27_01490 [Patescibacteria group bacterium]|nr:hypothetical protein [Patescibacteria group bacterium]
MAKGNFFIKFSGVLLLVGGMILSAAFLVVGVAVLVSFPDGNWSKKVLIALAAIIIAGILAILAIGTYELFLRLVSRRAVAYKENTSSLPTP